jgi:EmrB/QacA subfamily drug resistance transporter
VNRAQWTLVAMCFAQFMTMLDSTIVNIALPSIQRDLHTVPESLQWTVDAYVLTSAVLILLGGKLGDRFGRKRMFLVGMAIFTLASAACGLAESDEQLVVFRGVQGVGGALLSPLSLSLLVAAFPRRQLPTAIGIWAAISGIGLSAGPLLGGALVEQVSWSAVFWINVPIGLIAAALCLWAVAESRDAQRRPLDVTGTALVTAGLFALVVAVIGTNSHTWTSVRTVGLLTAATVLAALFLAWEHRHTDPMVPLRFFLRPAFSTSSTVALLVGFSYVGVLYLIVLYLQNVLGYSPLEAGVRTLPLPVTQTLVAANAGRIDRLLGARIKMSLGMLLISAGLFGLAQIHVGSSHDRVFPFLALLGFGMGLAIPAVNAAGMAAVDDDESGVGAGVITTARHVGGAVGIAVLGAIAAATARGDAGEGGRPDSARAPGAGQTGRCARGPGGAGGGVRLVRARRQLRVARGLRDRARRRGGCVPRPPPAGGPPPQPRKQCRGPRCRSAVRPLSRRGAVGAPPLELGDSRGTRG